MTKITTVRSLNVALDFGTKRIFVGRLAIRGHQIYFEYDTDLLNSGLEISPFHLPLRPGLQQFDHQIFDGLAGVFNDSLPDGWGRLLFDRFARAQGILPRAVTPLDRLAFVGGHGLGALVYEPDNAPPQDHRPINLDRLAIQAAAVLAGTAVDVLAELIALNGSSAGARPKALIGVDRTRKQIVYGAQNLTDGFDPWLVKFPNTQDGIDAGAIEYVYALMARAAGIDMPDVQLFAAQSGPGYFAIKRFDRVAGQRLHMHSASGLLHSDYRRPTLDYADLVALCANLTKDQREVEKLYRLAVFNVLAHNRDDHAKNFTFVMGPDGDWRLSPAYDLTFSSGPGGEQSTMVMGQGRAPRQTDLLKLADHSGISVSMAHQIIDQTRTALAEWPNLARQYGARSASIRHITKALKTNAHV